MNALNTIGIWHHSSYLAVISTSVNPILLRENSPTAAPEKRKPRTDTVKKRRGQGLRPCTFDQKKSYGLAITNGGKKVHAQGRGY